MSRPSLREAILNAGLKVMFNSGLDVISGRLQGDKWSRGAPDLIGFGQSGKPDIEYRFFDHVRYLDAFLDQAGITSAYVVAHDWGSALAFHPAARRPQFVRGLAFMEFIRPMPTWDDFHLGAVENFKKFRTPGGEKMILDENAFVAGVLPAAFVRKLTADEMAVYRAPFPTRESRRPTWRFPNDA
jgi:haloalkane dehalogenase